MMKESNFRLAFQKIRGIFLSINAYFQAIEQIGSSYLRETDKPKIPDNLIRHVLFVGEVKIAEVVHVRLRYDHYLYLHEKTTTGRNFVFAGVAFGIGFEVRNIIFDFSRNSDSKLGGITRLSIKTNLL